jgi:hypothetical protein
MGLCAVFRWCGGAETNGKAQSSSALDRISERIALIFKPCPAQKQSGNQPSKNNDLLYISIGYGGESVSQSSLKDKVFLTFLGQNPPFELRRKLAFRLQSFHEIHRGVKRLHRGNARRGKMLLGRFRSSTPIDRAQRQGQRHHHHGDHAQRNKHVDIGEECSLGLYHLIDDRHAGSG